MLSFEQAHQIEPNRPKKTMIKEPMESMFIEDTMCTFHAQIWVKIKKGTQSKMSSFFAEVTLVTM